MMILANIITTSFEIWYHEVFDEIIVATSMNSGSACIAIG